MCLAIMRPAKKRLSYQWLKMGWDNNPDGVGYCFAKDGTIIIKRFMVFDEFKKAFIEDLVGESAAANMLIHFRKASHGDKIIDNVHPFMIGNYAAFIHNGVIHKHTPTVTETVSDTVKFGKEILEKMPPDSLGNDAMKILLAEYIGSSKLAILLNTGEAHIVNADKGEWHKGIWFSNKSYKEKPITTTYVTPPYDDGYGHNYGRGYHSWDARPIWKRNKEEERMKTWDVIPKKDWRHNVWSKASPPRCKKFTCKNTIDFENERVFGVCLKCSSDSIRAGWCSVCGGVVPYKYAGTQYPAFNRYNLCWQCLRSHAELIVDREEWAEKNHTKAAIPNEEKQPVLTLLDNLKKEDKNDGGKSGGSKEAPVGIGGGGGVGEALE